MKLNWLFIEKVLVMEFIRGMMKSRRIMISVGRISRRFRSGIGMVFIGFRF